MRLGVLGGTFNPIHKAHIEMACIAKREMQLDRVLVMAAADPPHKLVDRLVSAADRYRMTAIASEGLDAIEPCDLELLRPGKSYTVDTLQLLKKQYPGAELVMIIGSDSMQDFLSWYHPREVIELAELACVPRKGCEQADEVAAATLRRDFGARLTILPAEADEISSTVVRERVLNADPIDAFVDPGVEFYIYSHGLYFDDRLREILVSLRDRLPKRRFWHTVGTMLQAVRLAGQWGADAKKARLAALLHDAAKYEDSKRLMLLSGDDSEISAVQHAFAGAVIARNEYHIDDAEVLRAIRLHCTGDEDMTLLDEIIYLADVTEQTRDFPGVDRYRAALLNGPEAAMRFALEQSKENLNDKGGKIHPATIRAYEYFKQLKEASI